MGLFQWLSWFWSILSRKITEKNLLSKEKDRYRLESPMLITSILVSSNLNRPFCRAGNYSKPANTPPLAVPDLSLKAESMAFSQPL
jgi:hypothetical protein